MAKNTEVIKPILKQSISEFDEVSISLDTFDDIFSDFDPSPYSERALSDDFIAELKKISGNKKQKKIVLKLLLPANMRNQQDEKVIIKSLHSNFKNVHLNLESEVRKSHSKGMILTLFGIITMLIASYISFLKPEKYPVHFLLVLFEPAGWFLLWTGLDILVYSSKETKKDLDFYKRMTKAKINFLTY